MPKKTIVLLPETEKILEQMGLQIKYARLRRKLTSELVAERAGISRATLVSYQFIHHFRFCRPACAESDCTLSIRYLLPKFKHIFIF